MSKEFFIYGRKPVEEALLHKPGRIIRVYIKDTVKGDAFANIRSLAVSNKIPVNSIDEKQIQKFLADDVNHQGVIALSKPFEYTNLDTWLSESVGYKKSDETVDNTTILILDHLTDVSNLGAIVRSSTASGIDAIIVAELNQAPVTSAVYKTSAGTVGRIPIIQVGNINQAIAKLKEFRFWISGLATPENIIEYGGSTDIWQYDFKTGNNAIIVGNEAEGIRFKTREHCDTLISIPMEHDVESLNASVSAALVCYEVKRQKTT